MAAKHSGTRSFSFHVFWKLKKKVNVKCAEKRKEKKIVSAWVISGYSDFLPQPKTCKKVQIGVTVSVDGCLYMSTLQPCDELATCSG